MAKAKFNNNRFRTRSALHCCWLTVRATWAALSVSTGGSDEPGYDDWSRQPIDYLDAAQTKNGLKPKMADLPKADDYRSTCAAQQKAAIVMLALGEEQVRPPVCAFI